MVSQEIGPFLDTTSEKEKNNYLHNLEKLVKEANDQGFVDKFFLIREDDYFPYEYMWMPTSEYTQLELTSTHLSSYLRDEMVQQKFRNPAFDFYIPIPQEDYNREMSKIPKTLGNILAPAHFRSTKHFTVNTPLGYTHKYNQVESNRKYIIIDSIQNFLDSPYHYSIAYHDAYLDVTHEFFPISEQATILMSEENYKNSLNDKDLQSALSKRKLVVFKGEESLAINMVLANQGALTSELGNVHFKELGNVPFQYDAKTTQILKQSIQNLARSYHMLYDQSHGNVNSKGGHFSDLYDNYYKGSLRFEEEVLFFLKQKYPEYSILFAYYHTFDDFINSRAYLSLIKKVGFQSIVHTFEEYNQKALIEFQQRRQAYIYERNSITLEQHDVFVKTLDFIKENYSSFQYLDFKTQSYLQSQMISFFHSFDIQSQLNASYNLLSFQEEYKKSHL